MKNRIEQINNDLGEFIGFSLDINDERNSILQLFSYPGFKMKTQIKEDNIIYSNMASDRWGSWSLINKQPEEFQIFPFIKSMDIEEFKISGLGHQNYWLNYFRRIIESNPIKILSNGRWKMIFSESINKDWAYHNNQAAPKNNLKGHLQINEVFNTENPLYSDFESANIPISIKQTPFADSGRIKFWRKKIKEDCLPPVILVHFSHLSNSIIIDGHCRLLASIMEDIPPNLIILYPAVDREFEINVEQADKRAKAVVRQFENNPKLKLEQVNNLLISFYDDRPWPVRRSTAKFSKEEEIWNDEVKNLIDSLALKDEISNSKHCIR